MHMPLPLKSDRQSPVFFPLLPVKLILIDAQLHMRIRFQQQVTASQVLLLLLPTAKPCFARTRAHQGQSVPTSVLLQFNLGGAHTAESAQQIFLWLEVQEAGPLDAKGGPGRQVRGTGLEGPACGRLVGKSRASPVEGKLDGCRVGIAREGSDRL